MAKLEQVISGDFYEVLGKIERGIVEGSMSASLEEFSDFESGTARCSVRVFERYSYVGDNRVSLNVTLFRMEADRFNFLRLRQAAVRQCFSRSIPGVKKRFLTN